MHWYTITKCLLSSRQTGKLERSSPHFCWQSIQLSWIVVHARCRDASQLSTFQCFVSDATWIKNIINIFEIQKFFNLVNFHSSNNYYLWTYMIAWTSAGSLGDVQPKISPGDNGLHWGTVMWYSDSKPCLCIDWNRQCKIQPY